MQVIYAHEHPESHDGLTLFLAGPSPRGDEHYNWRPEALEILRRMQFNGTVFVPLPRDGVYDEGFYHDAQVDWEVYYLMRVHAVAFWIPRDLEHLPGFTTNGEFGLTIASGRAVLGYPEGAPKMKWLRRLAYLFGAPIYYRLPETLATAVDLARRNLVLRKP